MNQLISFLQATSHMMKAESVNLNGYTSMQDFVLKNGRDFKPSQTCWALGNQNCFQHAAEAAMLHRDFTYCEGYAAGIIPVLHAWLVDTNGLVIETTWEEVGEYYYGIPFRTDWVRQQLKLKRHYSMIDQWEYDWPTIRAPKEKWLRSLSVPVAASSLP